MLEKAGLAAADIDLCEINEAFSCVPLATMKEYALDPNKVNIHGGAVALGHPLGATGARMIMQTLFALRDQKKNLGLMSCCAAGGMGMVMVLEAID